MTATVVATLAESVARISIHRPDTLNSLDLPTIDALLAAFDQAVAGGARALILTGSGRAFCSGADLGAGSLANVDPRDIDLGAGMRTHYNVLVERLRSLPIPVVIAVNGIAAGGGAALALAGDLVIAARSASFRYLFVDLGLMPDMGATWQLPRLVGRARARGLSLLGEAVDASTAAQWGLIWQVVDDEALDAGAQALAVKLAAKSPVALRETRAALDASFDADLPTQLEREAVGQTRLGRDPGFIKAVMAFLSKRTRKPG
jgi:2-(1,2-epoxy-1,2-dihydrophenyl)acetyl-CoA isomerase